MAQEVDTVNILVRDSFRPTHHGWLRDALVDAGPELARAGGPEAVQLRTATRAVGVSHTAAYRHFTDRDALLRAVCERCMTRLALRVRQRMDQVPESDANTPPGRPYTACRCSSTDRCARLLPLSASTSWPWCSISCGTDS